MINLVFASVLIFAPPTSSSEVQLERARAMMAYPACLYGTQVHVSAEKEGVDIVGLSSEQNNRPAFVSGRLISCLDARLKALTALTESTLELNALPDRTSAEAYASKSIRGVEVAFKANVMQPEVMLERERAFKKCLREGTAATCPLTPIPDGSSTNADTSK